MCPSSTWPGLGTAQGCPVELLMSQGWLQLCFQAQCPSVWQRGQQPRSSPIYLVLITHCSFPGERAAVPSVQCPVVKCQWCWAVFESLLLLEGLFSLQAVPASSCPRGGGGGGGRERERSWCCVIWQGLVEPTVENPFARIQEEAELQQNVQEVEGAQTKSF